MAMRSTSSPGSQRDDEPQRVNVRRRQAEALQAPSAGRISTGSYIAALAAAGASDAISMAWSIIVPMQLTVDVATALVIWGLLGFRPWLLVALVAEAIPGLAMFPTWLLVVMAYGATSKRS